MTISLKHAFENPIADEGDPNVTGPDEWNAEHVLLQGTGRLLGRTTAGDGATEEISAGANLSLSGGSLAVTGADLSKADDTNVTLTLGGTVAGALLKAVTLTLGWAGFLSVARGGTGSGTAADARTALGLAIGSDVQGYDADLAALAGLVSAADKGIQFTGAGTAATFDLTVAGKALLDDANAAAQRTTLGLGNVDNTSDANKPVSAATQTALDAKVAGPASVTDDLPAIFDGTTGKLVKSKTYAAFKTLLALVKGDVGLGNVDNTSDASKPVSTATQTALDAKAAGAASSTDNAAARYDSTTGKVLQNSALIIADTTGGLSRSGGGGVPVQGTNTNDNAASGDVGEYSESEILVGSAVSLTTNTAANITSILVPAGDFWVGGGAVFAVSGGAAPTFLAGNTNTSSATLPTAPNKGAYTGLNVAFTANMTQIMGIPPRRYSFASPTTVYLIGYATFSSGAVSSYGIIYIRKAR